MLDGSTCDWLRFTAPNAQAYSWAMQRVPVLIDRVGIPPTAELHGAGSAYDYETQFAVTIPALFDGDPVYVCAYGSVVDPQDAIDVTWAEGTCTF